MGGGVTDEWMSEMTKSELSTYHQMRYGEWSGHPKGVAADPERCAYEIWTDWRSSQCLRKRGHGPEKAFCKQHAKQFD